MSVRFDQRDDEGAVRFRWAVEQTVADSQVLPFRRTSSALGPLSGKNSWSTQRAVYHCPRPQPICASHGHTDAGGASMVMAWSVTAWGCRQISSPGSGVARSSGVEP
ncbi:MAG TPA: hypothetical protein VHC63_00680 [Acidimicrobiales bacterium]|nr:hypothetical protein [Acidimicrobiales bacterium]